MAKTDIITIGFYILFAVIIGMIGYNLFTEKHDDAVDKHIRELKYEQAQKNENENTLIRKKLEEFHGQENQKYKTIYR